MPSSLRKKRSLSMGAVPVDHKMLAKREMSTLSRRTVVEETDPVRVVVRVRPLFVRGVQRQSDATRAVVCDSNGTSVDVHGATMSANATSSRFTFDAVFDEEASQAAFFDGCGVVDMVECALEGYLCTVFAYGQTGSGKTHTITGPDAGDEAGEPMSIADEGIIQRCIRYLFQRAEETSESSSISIAASYIEIYNEQALDLLRPGRPLPVRWSAERGFFVDKLMVLRCASVDDLCAVVDEGLRRRHSAAHDANDRSSRSHSILTIYTDVTPAAGGPTLNGCIKLVDLAGSERIKDTKAEGTVLAQSNQINRSLLALGNCISALGDPRKQGHGHIPYRDSVLTMLLKDSLGGSSKTLMVACVSPAKQNAQESSNTLRYANRAKNIENKPRVQSDPFDQLVTALRSEISTLSAECIHLRQQVSREGAMTGRTRTASRGRDDDDMSDLAAVTRELLETKKILQKVMLENEELHREKLEREHTLKMRESALRQPTAMSDTHLLRPLSRGPSHERIKSRTTLSEGNTRAIDKPSDLLAREITSGRLAMSLATPGDEPTVSRQSTMHETAQHETSPSSPSRQSVRARDAVVRESSITQKTSRKSPHKSPTKAPRKNGGPHTEEKMAPSYKRAHAQRTFGRLKEASIKRSPHISRARLRKSQRQEQGLSPPSIDPARMSEKTHGGRQRGTVRNDAQRYGATAAAPKQHSQAALDWTLPENPGGSNGLTAKVDRQARYGDHPRSKRGNTKQKSPRSNAQFGSNLHFDPTVSRSRRDVVRHEINDIDDEIARMEMELIQ